MNLIRCAVRKTSVPAHPEEIVRQHLISHMIDTLGFPPALLLVETELSQLPHLQLSSSKLPNRRVDILCFGKDIHPDHSLYPLLLIEVKAVPITPKVLLQVQGYNHHIKSCYVCVANDKEVRTGWWNSCHQSYQYVAFLPTYKNLLKSVCSAT